MKISILHIVHGKHYGGGEKIVYLLNRYINKQEFKIETICLADGYFKKRLENEHIKVHLLKIKSKSNPINLLRLLFLVKEINPDLIHAHSFYPSILARLSSFFLNIPNICTIQSPFVRDTNSLREKNLNRIIDRLSSGLVNKYISVNQRISSELIDNLVPLEKVAVIYNGIEIDKKIEVAKSNLYKNLGLLSSEIVFGVVAGFRPRKGAEYFLKAIPKILAQVSDVKCILVGDSGWVEGKNYLQELKDLAKSLNILDKITFTGFRENVLEIMSRMDVVVLPSLFGEGIPLVFLEAMALRKPVVATDTEGNNEVVVDRETGILVPPGDSESLAKAIIELLSNSQLRVKMGQVGYERVKKEFDVKDMGRKYEEVYKQVYNGAIRGSY